MLWTVLHEFLSGTHFTFNCYRHWAILWVSGTEDGSGHFLNIKEGVTQGDPLAMISYSIGVLPLIRDLWDTQLCVTQPWYADDVGAGGKSGHILDHFKDMQARGPPRKYFPEPTKIILVVATQNVPRAEEFFRGIGENIVTGRR